MYSILQYIYKNKGSVILEEKDILHFVDEYVTALRVGNEQRMHQLEELGKEQTATLTDVMKAITNLLLGVNKQMVDLEQNTELNLNILIDALYKAELVNDDVLKYIEEAIEESKEKDEE
ncbi:hypothetical protein BH792_gp072 [Staphylococcus phage Stau2]|uniref:Uncharacterized protein n=1 Tax=Staphylococcus phage Stau2 TaxID=1200862 RepID=A0A0U1ZVE3_9CAUD|nr:hypothetical protein BH792_gp072 [Staphylococcus phage Stau2]AKA61322.1 hypothetical protein Stau2_71 [Staphylococcus phage Stau2]